MAWVTCVLIITVDPVDFFVSDSQVTTICGRIKEDWQ